MKCSVQAPSQLLCAQIAKLEGWLPAYHTEEMLGLASDPFALVVWKILLPLLLFPVTCIPSIFCYGVSLF